MIKKCRSEGLCSYPLSSVANDTTSTYGMMTNKCVCRMVGYFGPIRRNMATLVKDTKRINGVLSKRKSKIIHWTWWSFWTDGRSVISFWLLWLSLIIQGWSMHFGSHQKPWYWPCRVKVSISSTSDIKHCWHYINAANYDVAEYEGWMQ